MMKKTNFGPLLLLLLLAVTPRNSCANPIASPGGDYIDGPTVDGTTEGAPAYKSSTIANDMKEGANLLIAVMTWLKDNNLQRSHFNKSIIDLENQFSILPRKLETHRSDILEGLYKSQDRLTQLKSRLSLAADILSSQCKNMIHIYNNNEISKDKLILTANNFVVYANFVTVMLGKAIKKTKQIETLLSASKAFSIEFNAKPEHNKEEIRALTTKLENQKPDIEKMLNEDEQFTDKVTILSCIFTLGFDCTNKIAIADKNELERRFRIPYMQAHEAYPDRMEQERRNTNTNLLEATYAAVYDRMELEGKIDNQEKWQKEIDNHSELLNKIKSTLNSTTTLLSHVGNVKVYLTNKIDLITKWQISLEASILDSEDITNEDITYNIKGIIERLNVLIKACEDYLAHE